MKSVMCFGDSNVWGGIPGAFDPQTNLSGRHSKEKRWTGILQKILGEDYDIISESVNARTTNLDEIVPGRPFKNGLSYLSFCLETNYPLNLVVFWIGTNDTKIQYNRSIEDIQEGMRQLVKCVKSSNKGVQGNAPKILMIAPQPILKIDNLHVQLDDSSIQKSEQIAQFYESLAKEENCDFLNAGLYITSSRVDGVHLDESSGKIIAGKIADTIKKMIG